MIDVMVISRRHEAPGICSFELARADRGPLPVFSAGAHIDVQVPGDSGLVRQYSLCNPPGEQHRYVIGVLEDPASRGGSAAMHRLLQAGMPLRISEPRNLFPLAGSARRSLLFAGGIGITPILCMAEHLDAEGADFELHYCVRARDRAAFVARMQASAFAERVVLHVDDEPGTALDALQVLALPQADAHLYVCGPGGFMQHVLDSARHQGWPEANLHREYFAAAPVDTHADASFCVRLASSGREFEIPSDQSVIQVLEHHGVEIPVSCEQGVCGTCLTGVLEGVPEHRDLYLTEEEQAQNNQFTPCCSRARTALLVLDL